MQLCRLRTTPWQDEIPQGRQIGLHRIDPNLNLRDMRIAVPLKLMLLGFRRCQFGSDREELVLDRVEHPIEFFRKPRAAGRSEHGIEFIDRTIRANPSVVFRDPRASKKSSRPRIPGFCVDLHESIFEVLCAESPSTKRLGMILLWQPLGSTFRA